MERGGWIELHGALEFADRIVQESHPGVFDREVAVRFGEIGINGDRRGEFGGSAPIVMGGRLLYPAPKSIAGLTRRLMQETRGGNTRAGGRIQGCGRAG